MTGEPSPSDRLGATPVEGLIALHTVGRVLYVAPVVVAAAWLLRGSSGAWASVLGLVVVVADFLLAGWVLSVAIRISLTMYHAAAFVSFLVRLGLITLTAIVISRAFDIDRLAFGLSVVVSYMVLLALEAMAVARGEERELNWTS